MTRPLSLRSRVFIGALLWTVGLFMLAGGTLVAVMSFHPRAPVVVHHVFESRHLVTIVALVAMVAGFLHVRSGLSGMKQIRDKVLALHRGQADRLDGAYPAEVQPLVDDLNRLLDRRDEAVARAMGKAGDLAHGLKTPLAVLTHEAARADALGAGEIAASILQQVERMRRQVDYHLAHARAAASAGTETRSHVRELAEALARTLARLHAARALVIDIQVSAAISVRGLRPDIDEMLGNLLDNACRWARSRVVIDAVVATTVGAEAAVVISVDDDGPGLAPEMWETVLQRGVRADESGPGWGLGLAIVRDLAELHGGSVTLGRSSLGGLRAELRLPA